MRLLLLCILLAAACAPPFERRDFGGPSGSLRRGERGALDVGRPPAPSLGDAPRPPSATSYPTPRGRRLATFEGPDAPAPAGELLLPPALWRPALGGRAPAGDDFVVDGALDLDVDGDGRNELVVLGRPPGEGVALLLALVPAGDGHRLVRFARLEALRHGTPPRTCHAEWRIAGSVRRGGARLPVIWEERGVGCARLEGGGFDRGLLVFDLGRDAAAPVAIPLARARMGAGGAADVRDAVAYVVADAGGEAIWVRGVESAIRPCAPGAEPAFWLEELAATVYGTDGSVRASRDGRALPLPGGVLPPELLRSHAADCGR